MAKRVRSHATRVKDQLRREKRRKELRDMLGGQCIECGSTQSLRFHHLDPTTKLFEVTSTTRSWSKLVEEAKKCVLLCESCHRRGHAVFRHGHSPYRTGKCRCEKCHAAYLKYEEDYRRKRGMFPR